VDCEHLDGGGLLCVPEHDERDRVCEVECVLGRDRLDLYRHDRAERYDLLLRHDGCGFQRHGKLVFQRSASTDPLSSRAEQLHFLTGVLAGRDGGPVKARLQFGIDPDQNLRQQRSQSVNRHIAGSCLANGHDGLVPFVQSSEGQGDEKGTDGPVQAPAGPAAADSTKYRYAEHAKLCDVRELAGSHVEEVQHSGGSCRKDPAQQGIDEACGVLAAEVLRGKE